MTTKIYVTATDIINGDKLPQSCPIARAINRQVPRSKPYVYGSGVILTRNETHGLVKLPAEAARFADDYDHGRHVEPFSFQVEIPD